MKLGGEGGSERLFYVGVFRGKSPVLASRPLNMVASTCVTVIVDVSFHTYESDTMRCVAHMHDETSLSHVTNECIRRGHAADTGLPERATSTLHQTLVCTKPHARKVMHHRYVCVFVCVYVLVCVCVCMCV